MNLVRFPDNLTMRVMKTALVVAAKQRDTRCAFCNHQGKDLVNYDSDVFFDPKYEDCPNLLVLWSMQGIIQMPNLNDISIDTILSNSDDHAQSEWNRDHQSTNTFPTHSILNGNTILQACDISWLISSTSAKLVLDLATWARQYWLYRSNVETWAINSWFFSWWSWSNRCIERTFLTNDSRLTSCFHCKRAPNIILSFVRLKI